MSYDTNSVNIIGRLTRDPESSFTKTQKQVVKTFTDKPKMPPTPLD